MKLWTPEEDEALLAASAKGLSCQQIADKLGRQRNGVIGRLHRLRHAGKAPLPVILTAMEAPQQIVVPPPKPPAPKPKPAPPPKPAPAPAREEPATAPEPRHAVITDLAAGECRFSTKSVGRSHFFCGAKVAEPGEVWCGFHRGLVYQNRTAAQALKSEAGRKP